MIKHDILALLVGIIVREISWPTVGQMLLFHTPDPEQHMYWSLSADPAMETHLAF